MPRSSWVQKRAARFRCRLPLDAAPAAAAAAFLSYVWDGGGDHQQPLTFAWEAQRRLPWTHFLGAASAVAHAPRRGDLVLAYGSDGVIFDAWADPKRRSYVAVHWDRAKREARRRVLPWPFDLNENVAFANPLILRPPRGESTSLPSSRSKTPARRASQSAQGAPKKGVAAEATGRCRTRGTAPSVRAWRRRRSPTTTTSRGP